MPDTARLQILSFVWLRDTVVQGLWFWSAQGFQHTQFREGCWDESGQRRHRQLLGRLLWLDRPDIKNAVCQLPTHVGTATTRDEVNVKR